MRVPSSFGIAVVVFVFGCGDDRPPLHGIVLSNAELEQSYFIGNQERPSERDVRVPGATISLYFDKQLTKQIGNVAVSDANGEYVIDTKTLPPNKDEDGSCFMLVEKKVLPR